MTTCGRIVLVGTPIGNLDDLSPRAVEVLSGADVIYCEDTRHSRKLLTHAGITGASLRSLHRHNEAGRVKEVVEAAAAGSTVAVVSDAGMPGIADPPSQLVAAAAEAGVAVSVVPGPSASLCALVASGLATDRFCFEGFLPRSGRPRRSRLAELATETRTTVLFEAPGRVSATLHDLAEVCGRERRVAVARELTKVHEEVWRGTLADAAARAETGVFRGEVALVLAGASASGEPAIDDERLISALAERLDAGERRRGAVDAVAESFGVPRRRVYELALTRTEPGPAQPVAPGQARSGESEEADPPE
jgi:16S rRNA (cytidine1402-2'-O)-methyltransferase